MTTQTHVKPYLVPAGTALEAVWWKTGHVSVKAGGSQTGGAIAQVEVDDPRGTAPPMHIHRGEDETFFVISGSITLLVDGERIDAGPGDYAFVPRGTPHAYIVTSERARMLVTFSPAGFEEFFVEVGQADDGSAMPPAGGVLPSPEEFVRLLAPYGCDVVGPPPTLADLGAIG